MAKARRLTRAWNASPTSSRTRGLPTAPYGFPPAYPPPWLYWLSPPTPPVRRARIAVPFPSPPHPFRPNSPVPAPGPIADDASGPPGPAAAAVAGAMYPGE
jgi:hypothetical protein